MSKSVTGKANGINVNAAIEAALVLLPKSNIPDALQTIHVESITVTRGGIAGVTETSVVLKSV